MFDYETLRIIWWAILVFLICGFAVMDGFDFGIAMLLPFLGKTDDQRRVMLNTIGATWEGSQTWLVTLGGITFGAWSIVYAVLFSGVYAGLLLLLFALFLRPVGFDYRSKLACPKWRSFWDWGLFVGGTVPAVVLSLAAGNLMLGLPFELDGDMRSTYNGGLFELFTPFPLLCVLVGVSLCLMHGATFLHWRTENELAERAQKVIQLSSLAFIALFVLAGVYIAFGVEGYKVTSVIDTNITANPLHKTVEKGIGLWLSNYSTYPLLLLAPLIAMSSALFTPFFSAKGQSAIAFVASSLAMIGAIITAGGSMFPFVLPSSLNAISSLIIWDSSGSHYTLKMLLAATVVFMPIVLGYTIWVYRIMRGKVTVEQIQANQHTLY
ncbi:MAG: cytochrome d ubiquinol oxidase subunit II [Methylococcales bacterium]|nr:cytochrome d ubiquinol oxidase subunit II [Methylococcales bacterium]